MDYRHKAFLMISASPGDCDVLQFPCVDNLLPNIIMYRFARVAFGVSSSPYLLNSTIQHHLNKYSLSHPELVAKMLESFYVDDSVEGTMTKKHMNVIHLPKKP